MARQAALGARFELVLPNRPGFPPNPPVARVDFDSDAVWLEGVVAAGRPPRRALLRRCRRAARGATSSTRLADGDRAAGVRRRARRARGRAMARGCGALPRDSVRAYLEAFLPHVGAPFPLPDPLPPDLQQGAEAFYSERARTRPRSRSSLSPIPCSSSPATTSRRSKPSRMCCASGSARSGSCCPVQGTPCNACPGSTRRSRRSSLGRALITAALAFRLAAAARPRVRELHDLEHVDDVGRERDGEDARGDVDRDIR